MPSQDVINILRRVKIPLTSTQIASRLNIGAPSVRRILHNLKKDKRLNLKFRQLNFKEKKRRYGCVINSPFVIVYWLK